MEGESVVDLTASAPENPEDRALRSKVNSIWLKYDKSGDNILHKHEALPFLKATLREANGIDPSKEELQKYFETMDLDKSGNIDKEECFKFLKGFTAVQALLK